MPARYRSRAARIARWSVIMVGLLSACATLQQVVALRRVDFSLAGIQEGKLAGVALSRIASYRDLTAIEVGRIAYAFARNDVPLEFRVNVRAENPAYNSVTATMVQLSWTALLDGKETVSGAIDSSFTLPPGQPVAIPLLVRLNMRQFFDGPAEGLVDIAAGLAGLRSEPTRVTIRATPTIDTPIGPITYPEPITIVSRTIGPGESR